MLFNNSNNHDISYMRFKPLINILRIASIPLKVEKRNNLFTVYSIIVIFCAYSLLLSMTAHSIIHMDQLEYIMENVRTLPAFIYTIGSIHYLRYKNKAMEKILSLMNKFTWEELPKNNPLTGLPTMAAVIPRIIKYSPYITAISVLFVYVQAVIRITFGDLDTFYYAWYPFDISAPLIYTTITFSQVVGGTCFTCSFYGFVTLYATLLCITCTQLEKLRDSLLNIRQISPKSHVNQAENELITRNIENIRLQKLLNESIRHHQQIIEVMECMEDTWNVLFLFQFLMLEILVCLMAFAVVMIWGNPEHMTFNLFQYILSVAWISVICCLGNELTDKAQSVAEAAYGCDWVGAPPEFQRCISFIIARANKEFVLTAGKFIPASNKTLLNMLNESISLFMFLMHMRDTALEDN